jgi:hypothetical protein
VESAEPMEPAEKRPQKTLPAANAATANVFNLWLQIDKRNSNARQFLS